VWAIADQQNERSESVTATTPDGPQDQLVVLDGIKTRDSSDDESILRETEAKAELILRSKRPEAIGIDAIWDDLDALLGHPGVSC
jgi:hypothetical protein